jgi:hypothetical protein
MTLSELTTGDRFTTSNLRYPKEKYKVIEIGKKEAKCLNEFSNKYEFKKLSIVVKKLEVSSSSTS